MKKIFFLSHGLGNNGIDSFVLNVAKRLDKKRYEVYVVMAVDDNGYQQLKESEAIKAGIHVLRICDLNGVQRKIRYCIKLYYLLCKEKPNIIHSNMDLFNGINLCIAYLANVPVRVSHSHTSDSQYEMRTGNHYLVGIYRILMRNLIWRCSTKRLGCSVTAMKYLYGDKWKMDDNSKILLNGIELLKFFPSDKEKKKKLFQNRVLITVGRLTKVKNPDYIIKIMRKIGNDYKLIWVGDGELKEDIKKKINQYHLQNQVFLVGSQNDVVQFYKCADAFIFPSLFEGLPITLIEAQTAGLPCFVSKNVTREVDCGLCEYLDISEENIDMWVKRIPSFNKEEFRLNIKKLKKFSIENMILESDTVYSV